MTAQHHVGGTTDDQNIVWGVADATQHHVGRFDHDLNIVWERLATPT
jgi:hypothetical protein